MRSSLAIALVTLLSLRPAAAGAAPDDPERVVMKLEEFLKLYEKTPTPVVMRTPTELAALVETAFELVPPGVVIANEWHPDPEEDEVPLQPTALVAVGRKP